MRLRKKLLLAGSAGLLAGAIGYWCWDASTKTALAAAMARCRAAGLAVTMEELRQAPVPDADNAALVFEKLQPLLKDPSDNVRESPELHELESSFDYVQRVQDFSNDTHPAYLLDAAGTKALAAILETEKVRDLMHLVREAVGKPHYNGWKKVPVKVRFGETSYPLDSIPGPVTESAKLLGWHARLAVSRGQTDEAWANIWDMMVLADTVADEPREFAQLVRWDVWRMALRELEQVAATAPLSAAWNQKFSARLAGLSPAAGFAWGMDGNRVDDVAGQILAGKVSISQLVAMIGPYEGLGDSGPPLTFEPHNWDEWVYWFKLLPYHVPGVMRLLYADSLDLNREERAIVTQPSSSIQVMEVNLKAAFDLVALGHPLLHGLKAHDPVLNYFNTSPGVGVLSECFLHSDEGNAKFFVWRMRAKIITAEVGLALERYRQAKGEYPATLAALVPEFLPAVPADPFTEKPLIYRTEPGGAVVYSVGAGGREDGKFSDQGLGKDEESWFAGAAAARKFAPQPTSP